MKCDYCHKEIPDNAKICPKCKAAVRSKVVLPMKSKKKEKK